MFLPLAISFIPLFCLSVAQDFSVPSEWVNTTSTHSWDDRVQLAQSVIDSVIPHYDASKGQLNELFFGQNANLMSAIVIHDSLVPNRTNYNTTTDNFLRVVPSLVPTINGTTIGVTNDPLMWGLTGIYAYRAYNERPFLDNAISIWEQISVYMITRQDAASNSHPLKNITFPLECNGISLAGGVFWNSNSPQDTGLNAGTSGAYMALSAYLYEMTNNNTYGDAAELSRQFIQSHLYNGDAGYVMDFLDPTTCSIINNSQWTYNMGLYLEAISVYANKTNNVTLTDFANELTVHAVKSTAWNVIDGINIEELPVENVTTNAFSMAYKGMLIRALYEHWSRSPEGSDVAKLIESYIMIQHNALLNFARTSDTNNYSPRWDGPPVASMLPWGQLAALDVLNSAIGMAEQPSPIPIPTLLPTSSISLFNGPTGITPGSQNQRSDLGLIIGTTIGGVLFVILVVTICLVIWLRRRKSQKRSQPLSGTRRYSLPNEVPRTVHQHEVMPFRPPFAMQEPEIPSKVRTEIQRDQPVANAGEETPAQVLGPVSEQSSSRDSIQDLIQRLNRAMAQLPPPPSIEDSSSVGPPQYTSVA